MLQSTQVNIGGRQPPQTYFGGRQPLSSARGFLGTPVTLADRAVLSQPVRRQSFSGSVTPSREMASAPPSPEFLNWLTRIFPSASADPQRYWDAIPGGRINNLKARLLQGYQNQMGSAMRAPAEVSNRLPERPVEIGRDSPFSYSPPGEQAPTNQYNFTPSGDRFRVSAPGEPAPQDQAQFNADYPVVPSQNEQRMAINNYLSNAMLPSWGRGGGWPTEPARNPWSF